MCLRRLSLRGLRWHFSRPQSVVCAAWRTVRAARPVSVKDDGILVSLSCRRMTATGDGHGCNAPPGNRRRRVPWAEIPTVCRRFESCRGHHDFVFKLLTRSSSCDCVEGAQPGSLAALGEIGLMSANMLRAFQVGKARTSHEGPWSWMRWSPVTAAQVSWPACHLTKASASAVI
jgi:hypothetical protein